MKCLKKFNKIDLITSIFTFFAIVLFGLPESALAGGVIDLSGEWDLELVSGMAGDVGYGANERYIAKVTQEGDDFLCTCVTSGKRFSAGEKILKGQVAGRVFGEVYVQTVKDPVSFTLDWLRGNGVVMENGNTLIVQVYNKMHGSNITATLKKKSLAVGGKQ